MLTEHYTSFLRDKLAANKFDLVWRSLCRVEIALETRPFCATIARLKTLAARLPEQRDRFLAELDTLHALFASSITGSLPFLTIEMAQHSTETKTVSGTFWNRGDVKWFDGSSLAIQPQVNKPLVKLIAQEQVTVVEPMTQTPSVFLRLSQPYRIDKPAWFRVAIVDLKVLSVTSSSLQVECEAFGVKEITKEVWIGRANQCDLRVSRSTVSKWHVQVFPMDGQWFIKDNCSVNGVWLAAHSPYTLASDSPPLELEDASRLVIEDTQYTLTIRRPERLQD